MLSAPFRDKPIGEGLADGIKADALMVGDAAGKIGEAAVEGIVLGTPHGLDPVLRDLGLQDVVDAPGDKVT